jgi:hypothetical protein
MEAAVQEPAEVKKGGRGCKLCKVKIEYYGKESALSYIRMFEGQNTLINSMI